METAQCFDTFCTNDLFVNLIKKGVPKGHIVVVACKDECVSKLPFCAYKFFGDMGSDEFFNVGYRRGWVFIGISGENKANEKR